MEPFYFLNEESRIFLKRDYLEDNISPEERYLQIAKRAEEILEIEGFADKFFSYLSRGFYSLSTPVITNFGNSRGLPVSCFSSYMPDSMEGILHRVAEVGMMSKMGGGTSGYFGDLRERGANISGGFKSDGPVRFMELFESVTDVVSQGSARRGRFAAYLPVEHPDVSDFIRIQDLSHPIQQLSFGVTITDDWMESMLNGDKEKRNIWKEIIKKRFESGYPYIMFYDNVNNNAPDVYKKEGKTIHSSNLCVAGNQRVPTQYGMLTAKELHSIGEPLNLFDNNKIVHATPMQLIEKDAGVYKIVLDNGMSHTVTEYHKLLTFECEENGKEYEKVKECRELTIGDRVAIQTNKGIFGSVSKPKEAFLLGVYQSDGTQHKDTIMFDVWENDFDILGEIQSSHDYVCDTYKTKTSPYKNGVCDNPKFIDCKVNAGNAKKKRLTSKACKKALNFEKGYVPSWIFESDEKTQWQYVRGLLYADGSVFKSKSRGESIQISYVNINKEFLSELQILFTNLGLQSSIRLLRKSGKTLLPDGKRGKQHYQSKDCWRLIISNKNDALNIEENTGFLSRKNISLEDRKYRDNTKKYYKINSIEKLEDTEDVYCVKVDSDKHLWVCNGFITHNCSEINLSSSDNESFVCVLSSLNLLHWDAIKETDAIETLIYFLDAVNEEFVRKTENIPFMENAYRFAKAQRALGMGALGWHSYLQSKNLPFEGLKTQILNTQIWKTIREKADKATEDLASLLGEPSLLKGYGRRNVTTLAIAPTTSSSFILGQVSPSIEPLNSNYFVKGLAKGDFTYKNPYLKKLLASKNIDNAKTWKSILLHGGSVLHLDELSDDEKNVYKTFGEISQKDVVIQAAGRQKYIDQAQSLNLMVPKSASPKEVSDLLILGWRMGVKTFYYQRGTNPAQEASRSIMNCTSCEG